VRRRLAALLVCVAVRAAHADADWNLQLEAGSELDTNVHRTSTEIAPSLVGVDARVGGRFGLRARPAENGLFGLSLVGAAKAFAGSEASNEDVALVAGDARFDVALGDHLAPGLRLSYYDAGDEGAAGLGVRTGDAAAALTLRTDGPRLTASAGYRFFVYKPDANFDFRGGHVGLSLAHRVRRDDATWTLDAALAYTASQRGYDAPALANQCAPGAPVTATCLAVTRVDRADLFHDAAVELTYTGAFILGARYGIQVNDSNSFGQSLVRHRVELALTTDLVADLVLNAKGILQIDQYLDALLLGGDVGTFVSVEDEAKSGVIVHVTRELGDSWLAEARYAYYASPFGSQALPYQRQTVYLGLVYSWRSAR
jgi:hypothetical protein